jgi:hypothetical protein
LSVFYKLRIYLKEGMKKDMTELFFGKKYSFCVGFEVPIAVVMKLDIFWDIAPCSLYISRRFGGTYHFHLQGKK